MYIPPQSVPCGLLCLVAFHIRRGRYCLFSFSGFTRASIQGISRVRHHAFFVVKIAGLVPTTEKQHALQLIWVRNLSSNSLPALLVRVWLRHAQVQTPTAVAKPLRRSRQLYLLRLVGLAFPYSNCYHHASFLPKRHRNRICPNTTRKESRNDSQYHCQSRHFGRI